MELELRSQGENKTINLRRWSNIVQMLYKYFVFTGKRAQQTRDTYPMLD